MYRQPIYTTFTWTKYTKSFINRSYRMRKMLTTSTLAKKIHSLSYLLIADGCTTFAGDLFNRLDGKFWKTIQMISRLALQSILQFWPNLLSSSSIWSYTTSRVESVCCRFWKSSTTHRWFIWLLMVILISSPIQQSLRWFHPYQRILCCMNFSQHSWDE